MARISVFKGREARLNKAIFSILATQSPQTIYEVWRKLRDQRDFSYVRYHIVNRRIRALAEQGYIEKFGERRTKTGFVTGLYQLALKAYLAIVLDKIDFDEFIKKAPESSVLSVLGALTSLS